MNKIDISTEEKKQEVYKIFDSLESKSQIHKFYKISDNAQGSDYIKQIANEIGFDFNIYKERKRKFCLHCGKEIVGKGKSSKKFCNSSCAASYNNKQRSLNSDGTKSHYNKCPKCGKLKYYTSKLCSDCYNQEKKENIGYKTLGYFINGKKYLSTKCSEIRHNAKRILEESGREKVCQYCKNHEFDEILEVHHVKGILEHDSDTLIKEINSENNLVWLCPNHHTMIEKGLITLDKK